MSNILSAAEYELLPLFAEALSQLPGFVVDHHAIENGEPSHDARVELSVAGKPLVLWIKCKREVFPAQARGILWQFRHHIAAASPVTPFVLAQTVTAGARDLLKAEGLGFYDSTGTLFLNAESTYIYIDKGLPPSRLTGERKLFAQRRAQAVHSLLREPSRWFGVTELALAAQISPATASEVLTLLDRLEWTEARGQGPAKQRRVSKPGELLDAWAADFTAAKRSPLQRYFVPKLGTHNQDLALALAFDQSGAQYAISHESAAQRLAPLLTHVGKTRMRAVAGAQLDQALKTLGAQRVEAGWNLGLWEAKESDLQHRERIDSAWHASPLHVYLDLLQSAEGRTKELAEHLRQQRIGF